MNNFLRNFLLTSLLALSFTTSAVYAQTDYPSAASTTQSVVENTADGKHLKFEAFQRTELYFGMNKPGGEVTEEEFAAFLSEIVTREFPDGLTLLSGLGQFRDSNGQTVREKSKVLILLYPANRRKESNRKIELIRETYKTRFAQQSVLRVDGHLPARVSF